MQQLRRNGPDAAELYAFRPLPHHKAYAEKTGTKSLDRRGKMSHMCAAPSQAGGSEEPEERQQDKKGGWNWQTIIALLVALTGVGTGITSFLINNSQIQETRQGQNSDRWGTAINQLSSTLGPVQTGGIGGLESLSRESPDYAARTLDELSAFIQEHTPPAADCTTKKISRQVRSALEVIAELDTTDELGSEVDLSQTCLYPVHLRGKDLVGVTLASDADSGQGANLYQADLCGANLADAKASGGTHLVQANLTGANLSGADFHGADLRDAILDSADVKGANFRKANLTGASLRGINPGDANFTGAVGVSFSNSEPTGPPAC
jgi:uncharacterized protein YjbI with pentapeptide repeats